MGDQVEYFRANKAFRQEEKRKLREEAPRRLQAEGIPFSSRAEYGEHIVTESQGRRVDLYPGTNRWKIAGDRKWHYGIETFIDHAKGKPDAG